MTRVDDNEFIPHLEVIMTTDKVDMASIAECFEDFLRGCGFSFNGHLELVEEEEYTND